MKKFTGVTLAVVMLVYITSVASVWAAIPNLYTNDNFFTSEHDAPVSFTQDKVGNFSGRTQTGKYFYQRSVVTTMSVHLQYFSIDEANFYISSRGIILAKTDTVALSIFLSRLV